MRSTLFNVPIDWLDETEVERRLADFVVSRQPHAIVTVNPEFIMLSRRQTAFLRALQRSSIALPDGTGIIVARALAELPPARFLAGRACQFAGLALRYLAQPRSFRYRRVTGRELSERLLKMAAERRWRVMLLGAQPHVAPRAAAIWRKRYPKLRITASSLDPGAAAVAAVRRAKADILLVAYGAPKQELFIDHNAARLNVPVMIGVGGTFDSVAGLKYQPPSWVTQHGLEWLAYLITQPRRGRRIFIATIQFFILCITAERLTS